MSAPNELLNNLDKLHTTELGVVRIKKNFVLYKCRCFDTSALIFL